MITDLGCEICDAEIKYEGAVICLLCWNTHISEKIDRIEELERERDALREALEAVLDPHLSVAEVRERARAALEATKETP